MGDPRKQEVTLGPVVSKASAEHIRKQIAEAGKRGERRPHVTSADPSLRIERSQKSRPVRQACQHSKGRDDLRGATSACQRWSQYVHHERRDIVSVRSLCWKTIAKGICSGPVVGVMKVKSDEEALELMNDSPYGLTASIWTKDEAAFQRLLPDVEAGTVFMNRCDYLHPALGKWRCSLDTKHC